MRRGALTACLLAVAGAKEKVWTARPFRPVRIPILNESAACDRADPFPRDGRCYDRRKCLDELERRGQGKQDASRLAALFRNTSMLVLGDSVNLYRAVWKSNFRRPTPSTRRCRRTASVRWRGGSRRSPQ